MTTSPAAVAFNAVAAALDQALVSGGFFASAGRLELNPTAPFDPSGDDDALLVAAALLEQTAAVRRTFLGASGPRYLVSLPLQFEVAVAGGSEAQQADALAKASAAAVSLLSTDGSAPLGGAVQWLTVSEPVFGDLPPNGRSLVLQITPEVSAADPLGRTLPT